MAASRPAPARPLRAASSWGQTDIDSDLVGKLQAAGYHWEHAKQTPDGRWHHVISARNTALLRGDQVLMRRERLEALIVPAAAIAVAPPAGALSSGLQSIARDYIAAREKAGRALLEMASYLALARSMAKHGEWYTFLQTTRTSEDQADRLLDIDRKAGESPEYADAVRRNFLSPTTAALLARPSTPAVVVEQMLSRPEPPTKREVEQQIRAANPNPAPVRDLNIAPAPADDTPKTDTGRIAGIRRYLDQQRQAGNIYDKAVFDRAFDLAREIHDGDTWRATVREIHEATNSGKGTPAGSIAPIETRGARLGPGQPEPPPWPEAPEGWRWNRRGAPAHLIAPDGWRTADYNYPERALAEAQRRILSQPKAQPETPESRDADGPWFWASKSAVHPTAHCWRRSAVSGGYVSACGLEAAQQPMSGAKGFHCSTCEVHADRREIVPIPGSEMAPDRTAVLTRPRRPQSADVSAQLSYLSQLEGYATALEQRVAELERRLVAPLTFIRSQLAICEQRIADGTADVLTGAELATLIQDLDKLVDDESLDTATWEALSARIGRAQRDLAQLSEQEVTA